ncbi:MAG: hypothetical protein RL538_313 [Candidatus Parcubacteria bacterium]|jgi:FkbM family methyltransferase
MNLKSYIRNAVPPQYIYKLLHLKKTLPFFGGAAIKSYSGNGEDIILMHYLFKDKKNGFYVDVGSFHPKIISNTYQLHEKMGWRGINIDPNPQTHKLFKKYRPHDVNLRVGIAETEEEKTYYNFSYSGANTFDEAFGEAKTNKSWNTLLSKEKLPCVPLTSIFEKHLSPNTTIDLLDIDVEGLDLQVLKSNDWTKYRPNVVLVEDQKFRRSPGDTEVFNFLTKNGYRMHSYLNITLIMVEENFYKNHQGNLTSKSSG